MPAPAEHAVNAKRAGLAERAIPSLLRKGGVIVSSFEWDQRSTWIVIPSRPQQNGCDAAFRVRQCVPHRAHTNSGSDAFDDGRLRSGLCPVALQYSRALLQ